MKREDIYFELQQLLDKFDGRLLTTQLDKTLILSIQEILCQDQDKLSRRNMQIKELKKKKFRETCECGEKVIICCPACGDITINR
jgi:hypothetical protein